MAIRVYVLIKVITHDGGCHGPVIKRIMVDNGGEERERERTFFRTQCASCARARTVN